MGGKQHGNVYYKLKLCRPWESNSPLIKLGMLGLEIGMLESIGIK